ncbi:hypothetical protein GCM10009792_13580 [Microcella alkalica]|uniref:Uncharacterized protein n=1 Tax=Microcella alkalica TaxID=355930 RepID=A0A839E6V5_9MICO|nr:hypothetical protein [Microcella alkalica]MBA8847036.1 hypothetical protein [Microcella alkalica]
MNASTYSTQTGNTKQSVEELLRYAATQFERARLPFRHNKMTRIIRNELRPGDVDVRRVIDAWVDRADASATWEGFELFAHCGYADPTAALAAVRIDNAHKRVSAR